jgi:molecular chaperone GrpE
MGDNKTMPADYVGDGSEDVEIEFVDENSGADAVDEQAVPSDTPKGADAVDLGPSVEVEIERLESELDELRDIHLRKLAEFDNYRKRTERERVEITLRANEELVRELLPVLDNFDRALEHSSDADAGAFREGVMMIAKQLWDTLERQGVRVIDPIGQPFSPEFHEAVHRIDDESLEPGTVASVLNKGYLYNGRLVRPAMVGVVAEAVAQPTNGSPANGETDE